MKHVKALPNIKLFSLALLAIVYLAVPAQALERILLMPLNLKGIEPARVEPISGTVVKIFSRKYDVVRGEKVDKKVAEIFEKESRVSDRCDVDYCLREVAQSFKVEILASVSVLKLKSTCHISCKVHNVMENRVIFDDSAICSNCDDKEIENSLRSLIEEAIK